MGRGKAQHMTAYSNRLPLSDRCRGRWRNILVALGIPENVLNKRNQPCPMCGGVDRFRWTNHEDAGSYYCSGCGAGDGAALVMGVLGLGFSEAAKRIENILGEVRLDAVKSRSKDENIQAMREVWLRGRRVTADDPVGMYLANRGIDLTEYPSCIRYVSDLYHPDGATHAMIAQIVTPDGLAANIHRTWLTVDGDKAGYAVQKKVMAGSIPDGSAVRLSRVTDMLGIAEGIETALRASQRFGLPVWSVISEVGIRKFPPPNGIKTLVIFGDNDINYVGQSAAYQAAKDIYRAAKTEGRKIDIEVKIPEHPGTDWAD